MDLSKLPRLSESNQQAPPPAQTELPPQPKRVVEPVRASGAEVWISVVIGIILLLMYPRFLQWTSSRIFGTHFTDFTLDDGTIVPYPQVPEFWSDLGPTTFGVVLIFEGLVLAFMAKRPLVWAAFLLTVGATLFNLIYVVTSYSKYGLALISAIAIAFGGYIAMYQWKLLQTTKAS